MTLSPEDVARASPIFLAPVIKEAALTQALIDSVMAEVRRVALKYGVPREQLDRCVQDFARALTPHAGHKLTPGKSPSHYKRWFQGWARGWAAYADAQQRNNPEHP